MALGKFKKHAHKNALVGLDFSQEDIKLLKIEAIDLNQYQVETFGKIALPQNAITNEGFKDFAAIGSSLSELHRKTNPGTKNVAVAIPRSSSIIKHIMIDKRLNPTEIESRAWVEANRHFPELIGDIYLDFNIVGTSSQDESQFEVILVACRKDQILPYLEVIRYADLKPLIVDLDCYALERALLAMLKTNEANETYGLFNINYDVSSLITLHQGKLIYAHDQSFNGTRLKSKLEAYQKQKEVPDKEEVFNIFKENLSSHLRHSMHFFYSSRSNVSISKLFVSGNFADAPYICEFIQSEINIETEIARPFKEMVFAKSVDKEKVLLAEPTLMLCAGLALSEVN